MAAKLSQSNWRYDCSDLQFDGVCQDDVDQSGTTGALNGGPLRLWWWRWRHRARFSHNAPAAPSSVREALLKMDADGTAPKLNRDADVAGPDVDGNGVRDDLDAYINSLPDTEPQKRH